MNHADEAALAWALVDSAPRLLQAARTRLWIKVGAGDTDSAIVEMLTLYAESDEELLPELAQTLDRWMLGYRGADAEPMLRDLLDRISNRSPAVGGVPAMFAQVPRPPARDRAPSDRESTEPGDEPGGRHLV